MYYFDIFVPLLYRILEGAAGGFRECIAYRYGADIEYPVCLVGAIFRNHEAEESGSIGGRARVVVREISKEFLSMSAIVFVALVTSAILFLKVHYLSLTVFEIIAFAISFTWLVLMINALQKMLHESSIYQVKVVQLKEEI